ncbi:MAG TPA: copper resistance protein CopC, partial [Burkholderiaceae bacterium]|nr:copper resistance protein CopC [Burkholderiaceae bacterium]
FAHPTKLVSLKLLKGSDPIALSTELPTEPASTFSIPLPSLTPGQYQATWSTISADGHAMKGSLSFTIQAN